MQTFPGVQFASYKPRRNGQSNATIYAQCEMFFVRFLFFLLFCVFCIIFRVYFVTIYIIKKSEYARRKHSLLQEHLVVTMCLSLIYEISVNKN